MKNLPEFKALILRYESITYEEIKEQISLMTEHYSMSSVKEKLTGFGNYTTCKLCISLGRLHMSAEKCKDCTWVALTGDECYPFTEYESESYKTYFAIQDAETSKELLSAFKARAKYMRELLTSKNIEI